MVYVNPCQIDLRVKNLVTTSVSFRQKYIDQFLKGSISVIEHVALFFSYIYAIQLHLIPPYCNEKHYE